MFRKILVPVDGSTPSDAGVALAVRMAGEFRAELVLCHVPEPAQLIVSAEVERLAGQDANSQGQQILAAAAIKAQRAGVKATTITGFGEVVDAIVSLADETGADLIVMGTHGRGSIGRALLGSRTVGVLRHANVPVLVAGHAHVPSAAS